VRDRVLNARVARLATIDSEGRPHLVPICFALDGDIVYTAVDEKPKRSRDLQRLRNIRAHPRVALLVDEWDEDWARLWWVRLRGDARILEDGPERGRALELLVAKYEPYRDQPPQGAVIAIDVDEWRDWSSSG
jgi:PPOX class probable F420-dependent enzyme